MDEELHLNLEYRGDRRYHESALRRFQQKGYYPDKMELRAYFDIYHSKEADFTFTEDPRKKKRMPKKSTLIACIENLPLITIKFSVNHIDRTG